MDMAVEQLVDMELAREDWGMDMVVEQLVDMELARED